jgi:hypothetical protein
VRWITFAAPIDQRSSQIHHCEGTLTFGLRLCNAQFSTFDRPISEAFI